MEKDYLILKRASASRPSGEWNDDDYDYDVLADSEVVGRIMKVHAAPVGTPWMWTLDFWHHEDRTPTHGSTATRKAASVAVGPGPSGGIGGALSIPAFLNRAGAGIPRARSFNVKIFRRSHQTIPEACTLAVPAQPPARRPSDSYCERGSSAAAE